MISALTGSYRSLLPWDELALFEHLRRLSREDLRARFMGSPSEEALRRHADRPLGPDRQVIGWFHEAALRGAAELRFAGGEVEAALTVEPEFRRRLVGSGLLARALLRARSRGARRLWFHTRRDNAAMLALARRFGAVTAGLGGEVEGRIEVRPDAAAFWFDLVQEEAGQLLAPLHWQARHLETR
ncbi:MAG TPA: GNAT family N-acetyltransferase [Paracoccaceae bacterium]|nr:GNAT family N-acetyltransferase [Paracoccaceae bacterium]